MSFPFLPRLSWRRWRPEGVQNLPHQPEVTASRSWPSETLVSLALNQPVQECRLRGTHIMPSQSSWSSKQMANRWPSLCLTLGRNSLRCSGMGICSVRPPSPKMSSCESANLPPCWGCEVLQPPGRVQSFSRMLKDSSAALSSSFVRPFSVSMAFTSLSFSRPSTSPPALPCRRMLCLAVHRTSKLPPCSSRFSKIGPMSR
mmetsp:Transcript_33924/g.107764  ORF Transcript_33924/g.107764 Transcript_33924/m.107764 type:complete len:201 (+) Transcript_33924:1216-1818(+)